MPGSIHISFRFPWHPPLRDLEFHYAIRFRMDHMYRTCETGIERMNNPQYLQRFIGNSHRRSNKSFLDRAPYTIVIPWTHIPRCRHNALVVLDLLPCDIYPVAQCAPRRLPKTDPFCSVRYLVRSINICIAFFDVLDYFEAPLSHVIGNHLTLK